jgi:hypothetical protein
MCPPTRRKLLTVTATLSCAAAGCLSTTDTRNGPEPTTGQQTTSHTETVSETPATTEPGTTAPVTDGSAGRAESCRDGYQSIEPYWVVESYGRLAGYRLRVEDPRISVGETLVATLENVSGETNSSGNKAKFDIQYRDADRWRTIFGREDVFAGWSDEGVTHGPGEGFQWELTFTQDGASDAVRHSPTYHVCAPLEGGEYRFVYWGVTSEKEAENDYETDYGVAARFSVRS